MPTPDLNPELQVLEALLETCRQACALNPSYEVRQVALKYEGRFIQQRDKLLEKSPAASSAAVAEEVAA